MSGFRFSFPACVIAGKGRIVADDIMMLRKYAFPDRMFPFEEAQTLMALNTCCPEQCPEWSAYFVESLTALIIDGLEPRGMIDDEKAGWLMRTLATDGVIQSALELEVLMHVLDVAPEIPESLSAFALDQVRLAMAADAHGAYHAARPASSGVSAFDLAYIWRVLRGALDRGRLMLSPIESLILREIDECAASSNHHPAWKDIMAAIVPLDLSKQALRNGRWLMASN